MRGRLRDGPTETESGKADGALVWHDFFYGGRSILDDTWRAEGTDHSDDSFVLMLPENSDPSSVLAGTLTFNARCTPFGSAPQAVGEGSGGLLLATVLAVLDGLDSIDCIASGGERTESFPIRVFPYSQKKRLIDSFQPLFESCDVPGDGTGIPVQFFEWIYERSNFDALQYKTALGCFRIEMSSGAPRLWMRLVDGATPAGKPSDWIRLVGEQTPVTRPSEDDQNASCLACISNQGGRSCQSECSGDRCLECIESGGGTGCIERCSSDACLTCLEHGGGRGCASSCDDPSLPDDCLVCVENGGGSGCIGRCEA